MPESSVLNALLFGLVCIAAAAVCIRVRFYKYASRETCFVRVGLGGVKIIMDGGAFCIPLLQEAIDVSRRLLRLRAGCSEEQDLVTRDCVRAGVTAEFLVRVRQTPEAVLDAVQTLGIMTMLPDVLEKHLEEKLIGALRLAAAEMSMAEIEDGNDTFVRKVRQAAAEALRENGLEAESVCLTGLSRHRNASFSPAAPVLKEEKC